MLTLSNTDLEQLFHPQKQIVHSKQLALESVHPDWNYVGEELSNKGMTRALLYEEFKSVNPNLYSYSQFNRYYAK